MAVHFEEVEGGSIVKCFFCLMSLLTINELVVDVSLVTRSVQCLDGNPITLKLWANDDEPQSCDDDCPKPRRYKSDNPLMSSDYS